MAQKASMTKRYDSHVGDKANTKMAKRLQTLITDTQALSRHLGCSIQAVNQYKMGITYPKVDNLIRIADYYNVSVDYIIGITDVPNRDTTVQAVCDYTGLSETSVVFLHKDKSRGATVNSSIVDFLMDDAQYADSNSRPITYLIRYFLSYDGHGQPTKQIGLDGQVKDYKRKDGFVSSNAILLNSQIIENAVLDEIKRALITLKEQTREEASKDGKH